MQYEVEQKFAVADQRRVEQQLGQWGARLGEPQEQVDTYFAHPGRDFAATDEALRIRCDAKGQWITYKGPKIDATTKTRLESNLALADRAAAEAAHDVLVALGFRPVAAVRKTRRTAHLERGGRQVEIALDEVAGLGTFVEIELAADEASLDAARSALAELSDELGLGQSERRSYLEMLLASQRGSA